MRLHGWARCCRVLAGFGSLVWQLFSVFWVRRFGYFLRLVWGFKFRGGVAFCSPIDWPNKAFERDRAKAARPLNLYVSQSREMRGSRVRGYNVSTSTGRGHGSSEADQNRQLERGPSRQADA